VSDEPVDTEAREVSGTRIETTPELLREGVGAILLVLGVLALIVGVWLAVGAAWGVITGGIMCCIGGLALLQDPPQPKALTEPKAFEAPARPR
jgi:hypothetical protein